VLAIVTVAPSRESETMRFYCFLARLGLRAGEIVAMTARGHGLGEGRNHRALRKKVVVGHDCRCQPMWVKAIAEYLEGRPRSPYRNLFVRDYAPYTPFVASGPISVLVMKALRKAGENRLEPGAHGVPSHPGN